MESILYPTCRCEKLRFFLMYKIDKTVARKKMTYSPTPSHVRSRTSESAAVASDDAV